MTGEDYSKVLLVGVVRELLEIWTDQVQADQSKQTILTILNTELN